MADNRLNSLDYRSVFRKFRDFTMVEEAAYIANLRLVDEALANPLLDSGCIIECGTWKGGMAAGLVTLCGPTRTFHFFDSFRGLPPPTVEDGEAARLWCQNTTGPRYFNNCLATQQEFMTAIALTQAPTARIHVHGGFFHDTFPTVFVPPIAVLRLDVDWYEPTISCLNKFWSALLPGAIVLLDDYYDWEGCRKAVHCFLSNNSAPEAIFQSCPGSVAYITKI